MAASKFILFFLVFVCVACPILSREVPLAAAESEAELVPASDLPTKIRNHKKHRNTLTRTAKKNESEDFTGNPALDSALVTTIGSLASTLFKAIFGGSDDRSSRGGSGGGFISTIGRMLCQVFGGLFGKSCGSDPGTDFVDMDNPVNLTSAQLNEVQNYVMEKVKLR